jgi:hypothetical protein
VLVSCYLDRTLTRELGNCLTQGRERKPGEPVVELGDLEAVTLFLDEAQESARIALGQPVVEDPPPRTRERVKAQVALVNSGDRRRLAVYSPVRRVGLNRTFCTGYLSFNLHFLPPRLRELE